MQQQGRLLKLFPAAQTGQISRRVFVLRATAMGMAAPVLVYALQSGLPQAAAQDATPAAAPHEGTAAQKRGGGGELKLMQWQAPTHMGTHSAQGGKDNLAATLVLEPLMHYSPAGTLIANLVKDVPTHENGLLAPDNTTVTYNLLEGVTWSDGTPFTADDVVFTWKWTVDPASAATDTQLYAPIAKAEALSPVQVKLTFNEPQPAWYLPFSGSWWGTIYPAHVLAAGGKQAYQAFMQKPVGTGPYVVDSFAPNDQAVYVANEKYREPNKPFFAKVDMNGGGDAASAARAVLQTEAFDFAWNLQLEPEILEGMEAGGKGTVVIAPGASLEQIYINVTDPNKTVDGERSSLKAPHPFFGGKTVRQAINLAADRSTVASRFYSPGENATANVLVGLSAYESKNTSFEFNLEQANKILGDAGWTKDGGVRKKGDVSLSVSYVTTINSVRQKTQAVIKKGFEAIGFKINLMQTDAGVYFDSSAGNDQSYTHFYTDLGMSTATVNTPFPLTYMAAWYAGPNNENVSQKANGWGGRNRQRYVNPEYDKLYDAVSKEVDPKKSAELFIQMNDLLVDDVAVIPLVQRTAEKLVVSSRLRADSIAGGSFETVYWNIANWNIADGQPIR